MSEAVLKNDPAALIETLRRSVESAINEIICNAESEIKKMEDETRGEIEKFIEEEEGRYKKITAYEKEKADNLLSIELKKLKLDIAEDFINGIISELMSAIRRDSRYADFIKRCLASPLHEIDGNSVSVRISPEDAEFSELIIKTAGEIKNNLNVRVIQDESIEAGGAMVIDDVLEIVFNNTVERILYRKNEEIRRIIVASLNELISGER